MIADSTAQTLGPLFMNPDPDEARAYFRSKSRMKANKLMSLKEAVEKFVHDGDYLAMGGFGTNRTPVAACQEIVRQGRKNMGFAGHTSTHDFQILATGEVFDRVDIASIIGLETRGMSPCARAYMESGRVRICEWTNFSLAARLKAAAMGIPFLPTRNMLGTDTLRQSGAKVVTCPFTGKRLVLQPALYPDVSVIHVHEADIYGNCRIRGITISDDDLAGASRKLIITTERLIPTEEIRSDPALTSIPYYLVDAVCEVPYGAYPTGMPGEYYSDEAHLKEWLTAQGDPAAFASFLKRIIHDCPDHAAYIELAGGIGRIKELRARELMLHKEGIREEL
ncbi:MAG: CoA transferase subunit A [Spirochaetes bacterium]|nr:MAG: CoA transferase subunit A [Spirochaetota bacterium]